MSRCDLHLENYTNYYTAGQVVNGFVQCTFNSEKLVNDIYVRLRGEASTHWTEYESRYDSVQKKHVSYEVHYSGSEYVVSEQASVLKSFERGITLKSGIHRYPFSFTLPLKLPSSFSSDYGGISYKIKAVVQRPTFKFNYEAETVLRMFSPVNLNLDMSLCRPATRWEEKSTSSWFCWSQGEMKVGVNVPYTGIAIKQPFPIHMTVVNMSNINIEEVVLHIERTIDFKVTTPKSSIRTSTKAVFEEKFRGIGAHAENSYDKQIVIQSENDTSDFSNCTLIQQSFTLHVRLGLPCFHSDLHLKIPVSVGHIPLQNVFQSAPVQSLSATNNVDYDFTTANADDFVEVQPVINSVAGVPTAPSHEEFYGFKVPNANSTLPTAPLVGIANNGLPSYDQAMQYAGKS